MEVSEQDRGQAGFPADSLGSPASRKTIRRPIQAAGAQSCGSILPRYHPIAAVIVFQAPAPRLTRGGRGDH